MRARLLSMEEQQRIGERIKQLRQAKGWSLAQLGRQIGYTAAGVHKWESGDSTNMKNETLLLLAAVLGTDPYYLVFGPDRGEGVLPPGAIAPGSSPHTGSTGKFRKLKL